MFKEIEFNTFFYHTKLFKNNAFVLLSLMQTANEIPANVSKDRLTTLISNKQDFDVSSESPSSGISNVIIPNERPLLKTSKSFFIAQVVKRSFDTFAVIYPLPTLATV